MAGVDYHTGFFVDDEHVVVLVDDVEGDVLRNDLELVGWVGEEDADDIKGFDLIAWLGGLLVDEDAVGFGGGLYLGAGNGFEAHL